ncbi:hypothetical protein BDY21DRAFT_147659 [Lineolata rhizophorae]|uniref:Uncharacterized protein n=1 Tax=Lineolata rhizophorae TaxID=578093 RepID=A0A6A6NMR0_9PEZI|nr:hypothetical protein BDY21DRAFT_147659 [Lineolata rhizophorae]
MFVGQPVRRRTGQEWGPASAWTVVGMECFVFSWVLPRRRPTVARGMSEPFGWRSRTWPFRPLVRQGSARGRSSQGRPFTGRRAVAMEGWRDSACRSAPNEGEETGSGSGTPRDRSQQATRGKRAPVAMQARPMKTPSPYVGADAQGGRQENAGPTSQGLAVSWRRVEQGGELWTNEGRQLRSPFGRAAEPRSKGQGRQPARKLALFAAASLRRSKRRCYADLRHGS